MRKVSLIITLTFSAICCLHAQIKNNWEFKNELISYMESPHDTIYIQDRKKLEKIGGLKCNDSSATFKSKSLAGDSITIFITSTSFIPRKHIFVTPDSIDGKRAFGDNTLYPEKEIKTLQIKWGNNQLIIPDSAFHNLYEMHLCLSYRPVEAYITKNNKLLYLY